MNDRRPSSSNGDRIPTLEQILDPYYYATTPSQRSQNQPKQKTTPLVYTRAQSAPPIQHWHRPTVQSVGDQLFGQSTPQRPQTVPHGGSPKGEARSKVQTYAAQPKYNIQQAPQQQKLSEQQLSKNQVKAQAPDVKWSFNDGLRIGPNHQLEKQHQTSLAEQSHVQMMQQFHIQRPQMKQDQAPHIRIHLMQSQDAQMQQARAQPQLQQPQVQRGQMQQTQRQQMQQTQRQQMQQEHIQQDNMQLAQNQTTQMQRNKNQSEQMQQPQTKREQMQQAQIQWEHAQQTQVQQEEMHQAQIEREQMQQAQIQREHMQQAHIQREQMQQAQIQREQMQQAEIQREQMQQAQIQLGQMRQAQIQLGPTQQAHVQFGQMQQPQLQREHVQQVQIEREQMREIQIQNDQMQKAQQQREPMRQVEVQREQIHEAQIQFGQMQQVQLERDYMQQVHIQRDQMYEAQIKLGQMQQSQLQRDHVKQVPIQREQMHEAQIQREQLQQDQIQQEQRQRAQIERELVHQAQMQLAHNRLHAHMQQVQPQATQQAIIPQGQMHLSYQMPSEPKMLNPMFSDYVKSWEMQVVSAQSSAFQSGQSQISMQLQTSHQGSNPSQQDSNPPPPPQPQYLSATVDAINVPGSRAGWGDSQLGQPFSVATVQQTASSSPSPSPVAFLETPPMPPPRSRPRSGSRRPLKSRRSSSLYGSDRPTSSDTYAELVRQELEKLMGPEKVPSGVPAPSALFPLSTDRSKGTNALGGMGRGEAQNQDAATRPSAKKDAGGIHQAQGDSVLMGNAGTNPLLKSLETEMDGAVGSWPKAAFSTRWLSERLDSNDTGRPVSLAQRRKMEGINMAEVRRARAEAASRLGVAVAAAEHAARCQAAAGADPQLAEAAAAAAARDYRTFIVGQVKSELPPTPSTQSAAAKPSLADMAEKIQPSICILGYIGVTRPTAAWKEQMSAATQSNSYIGSFAK